MVTVLLVVVIGAAAQRPAPDLREQVAGLAGYLAQVRLTDGRKLTGRVGAISDTTFVLEEVRERKLHDETIPFADLKSVRAAHGNRKHYPLQLAIVIGGAIALNLLIRLAIHRK